MSLGQIIFVVVGTLIAPKLIRFFIRVEREARAEKKREKEKYTQPPKKRLNAYVAMTFTGFYEKEGRIAVIGVMTEDPENGTIVYKSFSGKDLTPENLQFILNDISIIYTFSGTRDIFTFFKERLGIKLMDICKCRELVRLSEYLHLKTNFQELEKELKFSRKYARLDQPEYEKTIRAYAMYGDKKDLDIIEKLNEADLINIRELRYILEAQVSNGGSVKTLGQLKECMAS